mgnify:CR=1 FL=1
MTKYVLINGVRREMTSEEEAKFNKDVEDTKKIRDAKDLEEKNKETKKESGKQKLKDLGLDDDEINALMGA